LNRGEVWTVSGGPDYAGKPRPTVILQDDRFNTVQSITVCGFTTDETDAPLFRLPVDPSETNGLTKPCRIMVDKIMTVPRSKLGRRIGRLGDTDMLRLNRAVLVFLGLAG
jgi:mRNA interferase MazF